MFSVGHTAIFTGLNRLLSSFVTSSPFHDVRNAWRVWVVGISDKSPMFFKGVLPPLKDLRLQFIEIIRDHFRFKQTETAENFAKKNATLLAVATPDRSFVTFYRVHDLRPEKSEKRPLLS